MQEIRSLEKRLARATDWIERIDLLNQLAWELRYKNHERALTLSQEAFRLSNQPVNGNEFYKRGLAESHRTLGQVNYQLAQYDIALQHLLTAKPIFAELGDFRQLAIVTNIIGTVHGYLGNTPDVLEHLVEALRIARQIGARDLEVENLNDIGYNHNKLGDYARALEYLQEALQVSETLTEDNLYPYLYDSLSTTYLNLKEYPKALQVGRQGIEICRKMKNRRAEAQIWCSLGQVQRALQDTSAAREYFERSLGIAVENGYKQEIGQALQMLADLFVGQGYYSEAISVLEHLLRVVDEMGARHLRYEAYQSLAMIYKKMGDFARALEFHELFHNTREQVVNESAQNRLKSLEAAYQLEAARRDAEISQLRNVELQHEIEERKKAQAALEELANTHPLSGLFNRRQFFLLGEHAFQRARRYNLPLSVLMIDIDDFKLVNDKYGHLVGDQVIKAVAVYLSRSIRKSDIIGHYGGDEFCILMPDTDQDKVWEASARIHQMLSKHTIPVDHEALHVTLSIGITCLKPVDSTLDALVSRADRALYRSKRTGKNRSTLA